MTNQQGAPEALRLADLFELERDPESLYRLAAAELRRLHAENERLAALVEAQQPAPSAAADWKLVPEGPTPDMVRAGWELLPSATGDRWDAGAVLARSIYSAMLAAAPQPSPTPQADSQPAPVLGEPTWTVFNSGAQVAEVESLAEAMEYLTPERLSRQWCAVCVVDQSNMPKARAPADSVLAPALSKGEFKQFLTDVHTAAGLVSHGKRCKALGERLGNAVMRLLAAATAPAGGVVARVLLDSAGKPMLRPQLLGEEFLADPEAFDAMYPHRAPHRIADLYATPPAKSADSVLEDAARLERERICAAIKAEDDYCVDQGDYMLDSDDCIKIVRGEWVRPDFSVAAARKQGANHDQ